MNPSNDRLARLLVLVPYFVARPGITLLAAAADLGTTADELRADLELLFVCGLPGYGPGDLIDMSIADDTVTITYDAGMNRPLRLTTAEAMALLVALRALADTPGLAAGDVVKRALAKVAAAAGEAAGLAERVAVQTTADSAAMTAVSGAVERQRALRITYYSAARDASSDRTIDPMRIVLAEGVAYVEAWCRTAQDVRLFRLDRIDQWSELDERAAPPPNAAALDVRQGVYRPDGAAPRVELSIGRGARWITEYYHCDQVLPEPDGRWRVTLPATDLEWARRLAMGLGDEAVVLNPPELIAAIAAEAQAALVAYSA